MQGKSIINFPEVRSIDLLASMGLWLLCLYDNDPKLYVTLAPMSTSRYHIIYSRLWCLLCGDTEYMFLVFHCEQIVTKWVTGAIIYNHAFYTLLHINPSDNRIVALTMFGQEIDVDDERKYVEPSTAIVKQSTESIKFHNGIIVIGVRQLIQY